LPAELFLLIFPHSFSINSGGGAGNRTRVLRY
jgi:hypothetical protein